MRIVWCKKKPKIGDEVGLMYGWGCQEQPYPNYNWTRQPCLILRQVGEWGEIHNFEVMEVARHRGHNHNLNFHLGDRITLESWPNVALRRRIVV